MRSQLTAVLSVVGIAIISAVLIGSLSSGAAQPDASPSAPEVNAPQTSSSIDSAPENSGEHSLDFATNSDAANMYVRFHYGMLSNLPEGGELGVSVVGVFQDKPIVGTKATVGFEGGSATSARKLSERVSSEGFVHVSMPVLGVTMNEEIHPEMKPSSDGYTQLDKFEEMASKELDDSQKDSQGSEK